MNVLLSRAKWMMVVVGCLDFYSSIVEFAQSLPDVDVDFLRKFKVSLDSAKAAGDAVVIEAGARGRQS